MIQETEINELDKVVAKSFSRSDGPFVKNLDQGLKSFHVEKEAYFGGTFVGNHVHSCLKVHTSPHSGYVEVYVESAF